MTESKAQKCNQGVILPIWMPQEDLGSDDRAVRGIAYFLSICYMFIGVSIVSDRFMGSIEVITSKEREIKVKRSTGETQVVVVRVWNETVANLTLMALGSSAPEILLSIIEIVGKLAQGDFESASGELGPGTIVGSAAFNLLIIIAICIYVIPDGEIRRINHLRVFIITATWSVFAYIWLLIILQVISVGVVEIWEGVVTFLFFPATVITSYIADRKLLIYKFLKTHRLDKRGMIVEGEAAHDGQRRETESLRMFEVGELNEEIKEFEEARGDYIDLLRVLRKKHPNKDKEQLEALAIEEIQTKVPKSRAFYRMQATRKLLAGQSLAKKVQEAAGSGSPLVHRTSSAMYLLEPNLTTISFNPAHYTVMETVGSFDVTVIRVGGDINQILLVDYKTEDGTATADADYISANGTVTFLPGEDQKKISIRVIDDEVFEEDEHFYIRLSRARFAIGSGAKQGGGKCEVQLAYPYLATVMILDDDHGGIFTLEREMETTESVGVVEVKVNRWSGARGKILLAYTTIDGTAKAGKDYEHLEGKLIFDNNEIEKVIEIRILQEDSYEKDVIFYVQISHPIPLTDSGFPIMHTTKKIETMNQLEITELEGWPKLGPNGRTQIRIKECKEFKGTVDKLLTLANMNTLIGTSSWKEQFVDAMSVGASEEGGDTEDNEPTIPSCCDYVVHFLTIFWKIIFAFVPPTNICGGYISFIVSIMAIGVLTALIGDLAAHFGCSVGLRDSVTAITFVALGTSIPDTFASKVAAIQDEYADASIGNVTGSNAVNVFLGIGIAWTIAAIMYACRTCSTEGCNQFKVDPGSLGFSVTLFCTCAVVAISVILIRRLSMFGGGELGGPSRFKYSTVLLFVALWIFYIVMSSLEAYKVIQGF